MNTPENSMAYPLAGMPAGRITSSRTRPTAPVETAGFTPRDIWMMIRRRLVLVIITTLIFSILGVVGNIMWKEWWPTWPGVAWLEVDSPEVRPALEDFAPAPAALLELYQKSQVDIIRSPQYIGEVLADDKIRGTDWFKKNKKNPRASANSTST